MTAQIIANELSAPAATTGGMFLGFRTTFRKELSEWLHGPRVFVIAGLSVAIAIFTTMLTRIEQATVEAGAILDVTTDPTANALLGWSGQVVGIMAIIAVMSSISVERDRGTLAWTMTNPVSPTSILAAKFTASMVVFSLAAVVLPMIVAVGVATVAYGALPDLGVLTAFSLLFLAVPAFFLALTIGLGAVIRSTAGIAAVALAVLFVPQMLGGLVPHLTELSPTSVGQWAQAVVRGDPAPLSIPISWLVSMVVIVVGAKLVFDRQEF
jgi:ABC-2 type transport system permease protein